MFLYFECSYFRRIPIKFMNRMYQLKINKKKFMTNDSDYRPEYFGECPLVQMNKMLRLRNMLRGAKKAVIVAHKDPDGDAFGSTLAFKHYLHCRYPETKATVILPNTDLALNFSYLPGWGDIIDYSRCPQEAKGVIDEADLIVCLDFNNWSRSGRKSTLVDALKQAAAKEDTRLIHIDHHEKPDVMAGAPEDCIIHADFAIIKPERPSTCEILTELFEDKINDGMRFYEDEVGDENRDFITEDCATCLYNGIMTDTINFTTRNPSWKTFYYAADLIRKGADNVFLYNKAYNEKPAVVYCLQAAVEASTKKAGDAAWYIADQEMLQRYNYKNGYLEGMPDKALSIAGVELSFGAREEKPGMFKVGIRSPKIYNCVKIAQALDKNGGGHTYAANGSVYTDKREDVEEAILNILKHKEEFFL